MLPPPQTQEFFDRVLVLESECRQELEASVQSLSEISLLLSKTNSEVEKLANRDGRIGWGELALEEERGDRAIGMSFYARWSP